ncbi:MAG TPA: hypothetical protein VGD80_19490, partial [Kofleriaceae bacterium]
MSKRDDDSQADMEVGMTTAERRRRRRRGGGLRVPSDNVPRRSSTPPVVAPVPEDPALAMSIAYSFSGESSDPMPRATLETPIPSFENHEGMPTAIDPVNEQVEQGDFEMKTREMTAVDLEALGLSDAGSSGNNLPIQRLSSPTAEAIAGGSDSPGVAVRFRKRDATDPVDDVDVELDSIDSLTDGGTTLDQDEEEDEDDAESSDVPEVDSSEFATIDPGDEPSDSEPVDDLPEDYARIGPPVTFRPGRAQTVALSEDDLEEMREAARFSTQAARPASTSMPPPTPPAKPTEIRIRAVEQSSPEIDIMSLVERASEAASDFDVDVEGEAVGDDGVEAQTVPQPPPPPPAAASEQRTRTPSQPPGHGHPPSNPPPLHSHPPSNPPPIGPQPRDSQPIPITREPAPHAQPPPPPGAHKAPPAPPPPVKRDKVSTVPIATPITSPPPPLPATLPVATPVPPVANTSPPPPPAPTA